MATKKPAASRAKKPAASTGFISKLSNWWGRSTFWVRGLVVVLVFALVGGSYMAYQTYAASPTVTYNLKYCRSAGITVRYGSNHPCVKAVQMTLQRYVKAWSRCQSYNIGADGAFGPVTRAGVICYQKMVGITQDGVVGPVTYGKLYKTCWYTADTNGDTWVRPYCGGSRADAYPWNPIDR